MKFTVERQTLVRMVRYVATGDAFSSRFEEIAQAQLRRRENVRLECLPDDFPGELHPSEIDAAWHVLEQMENARETFPFAIRREV